VVEVVVLLGRAGTGKTTIARWLEREHGGQIVSLAAPLKLMARDVMGFSDAQLYGSQEEKAAIDPRYGFSARAFLQRLGTEGVRKHLGPDVWAMDVERRIVDASQLPSRPPVFVVDDCRFPSEARYLRRLPRANYAIRSRIVKLESADAVGLAGSHESESAVDEVDLSLIDATVVSSRAHGCDHLLSEFRRALPGPWSEPVPRRCEWCFTSTEPCRKCGSTLAALWAK
jgi:hypothetical protein